ncbi:C69 family dipeptidase [bacterium]|nr:C69 family dipeptidase [bacterium]
MQKKTTITTAMSLIFTLMAIMPLQLSEACTSILVTRKASKNGATYISYSCDGSFHPHPSILPAADYTPGTMLEIRRRGGIIKEIPQVLHTYKVVGLMNEHQLAIGETTFGGRKALVNPDGLFHYYPLMRIMLQRARTAREAIDVMAELVEEYGYGSEGESISIADKEEVWLLEIVGTGQDGKGAVWVAVKIPDGMICATANMARIREFDMDDHKNIRYSENVISFAIEKGFYDPKLGRSFSFADAYCPATQEQIRYSARRIWSIFRRLSPSLNLSSDWSSYTQGAKPYPLYIKPDNKLNVQDVIAMHRDHYEGTEFDMTKDYTAGPFGAPDKWRPLKWTVDEKMYAWERPIATQQAAFVHVTESRKNVPDEVGGVYWYGFDNPYTNFFVPFYTSITELPTCFTTGSMRQFSRDSGWWALNFVANYANLRWSYMIKDIQAVQKEIETTAFALQPAIEATAMELMKSDPTLITTYMNNYCISNAETSVKKWWELADLLVRKYNDGYIQNDTRRTESIGYPEEWLRKEVEATGTRKRLKEEKEIKREL